MNKKLFVKSLVTTIVAFTLSYICYQFSDNFLQMSGNFLENFNVLEFMTTPDDPTMTKEIACTHVDQVEIRSKNANINIRAGRENHNNIDFNSSEKQGKEVIIKKMNHSLVINLADKGKDHHPITLELPNTIKSIRLTSVTGDIDVKNLSVENLSINTTSGDITLDKVKANKANIDSVSGDVSWDGMISFAIINTVSGDITIDISERFDGTITASSINGDISVPHNSADGNNAVNIKSVSGDITVSVP